MRKIYFIISTIFASSMAFANGSAAECQILLKPDGTDPLKQVGIYKIVNDPSYLATKLFPVDYVGSSSNGSLKGNLEVSSVYSSQKDWLGVRFRYLPEAEISRQSDMVVVEFEKKSGFQFRTNLSFPEGEIQLKCIVM